MTMITPSYLGETIEYSSLHACRSTLEDPTFGAATSYAPFPLLCLRTMKSDAVAGLPPGLAARLDASDGRWRIDGRRGLAQLGGATSESDHAPRRAATAQP